MEKQKVKQLRDDIEEYVEKHKNKPLHLLDISELFRIITKSGIEMEITK